MIWVTDKYQLDYYTVKDKQLCYCSALGHPTDMVLQGFWSASATPYTLGAAIWSVDGNTALENIPSDYYEYYIAAEPNTGRHFFTFRLKQYSPGMCANKCFLMRIGVTNGNGEIVFAAWTQRYCIKSCCDVPRGITVIEGGSIAYDSTVQPVPEETVATTQCGHPLLRIIGSSECYNAFNGHYYGVPTNIISGGYIPYTDVIALQADIKERPRNIQVLRAFNGKLQRAQSIKPFRLASQGEVIPTWLMNEIEALLHGKYIWVDDYINIRAFDFAGGTAFTKIGERICDDIWRLEAQMQEREIRQTFGCITDCNEQSTQQFFVIPQQYQDEYFFDANGNVIAQSLPELYQWLFSQGLSPEVMPPVDCNVTQIIGVTGNNIPPVVYWGSLGYSTAINPLAVDFSSICDYIPAYYCQAPVIGTITFEDVTCATPVIGTITYEDISAIPFFVNAYSGWAKETGTEGEYSGSQATFRLNIFGDTVVTTGNDVAIAFQQVAVLENTVWPSSPQTITSGTDNEGNLSGWQIDIGTDGSVRFTGTITVLTDYRLDIDLSNLTFTI